MHMRKSQDGRSVGSEARAETNRWADMIDFTTLPTDTVSTHSPCEPGSVICPVDPVGNWYRIVFMWQDVHPIIAQRNDCFSTVS